MATSTPSTPAATDGVRGGGRGVVLSSLHIYDPGVKPTSGSRPCAEDQLWGHVVSGVQRGAWP